MAYCGCRNAVGRGSKFYFPRDVSSVDCTCCLAIFLHAYTPCASGRRNSNNACRVLSVYVRRADPEEQAAGMGLLPNVSLYSEKTTLTVVELRVRRANAFYSGCHRRAKAEYCVCAHTHWTVQHSGAVNRLP